MPPRWRLKSLARWAGVMGSDTVYVKRVIGVPGDRITCCSAEEPRLTVNGTPMEEPYVYPGDAPSEKKFDVVVDRKSVV